MKRLFIFLSGLGLLAAVGCGGGYRTNQPKIDLVDPADAVEFGAVRAVTPGYRLAVQDVFDVSFLFEPQLSTRVKVRPDGGVALPIVGDIRVAGRTPGEVDSLLTTAYATYFKDPEVTVNVVDFAPPTVYVLGMVRIPNEVELKPGMTVLQAVASVGGPVEGADLGSVVVLRRLSETKAYAQRVDLDAVLSGKVRSWQLVLTPQDIIYVPPTFVTKLDRFVDHFFTKLTPIPVLYLRGWEAFHTADVYDTYLKRGTVTSGP